MHGNSIILVIKASVFIRKANNYLDAVFKCSRNGNKTAFRGGPVLSHNQIGARLVPFCLLKRKSLKSHNC